MTVDEAMRAALEAGALKPQGFGEGVARNVIVTNGGLWVETPRAQGRLRDWTNAILNGVDPRDLKSQVG
jgi:hypothetical protein